MASPVTPRHKLGFVLLVSGVAALGDTCALYACFAPLSFFIVWAAVWETKGRTPEEM